MRRRGLRGVYPILRLSDAKPLGPAEPGEEIDLGDLAAARLLTRGAPVKITRVEPILIAVPYRHGGPDPTRRLTGVVHGIHGGRGIA